ncbi:MAG: chlorohydrolase family protein [Pyramidobacter sp.]|nr:chlorohydrolase family protein [Pyramidobacter sp.]
MKKQLSAHYVIAFDGTGHKVLENGHVVYEGHDIIYVGKDPYPGAVDESIDCGEAIISPGFIDLDALGDIDHGMISCEIPSDMSSSLLWSKEYYDKGPYEPMTAEEEAFKSLFAYAELIRNGTTTAMPITSVLYKKCAETYKEIEAAAHNAGTLGLRVYLGPSYQYGMRVVSPDGTIEVVYDTESGDKGLENAVRFVEKYDGAYDGLICGALVPERIETQTVESLLRTKKEAERLGCPVRLHAAQGLFEYQWIAKHHGKSPIQLLESLNFLGNKTLIPHGLFTQGYDELPDPVPGDDMSILVKTGTTVIHCPLVYARSGIALQSFGRYKAAGVNMAMGTDTFPASILENIKIGSYMARRVDRSPENNRYADFFNAATLGGAKALGRDDLGRLCAGAKADIVVFDLTGRHIGPIDDPLRTLVSCGGGRDLKLSIINGRCVFKDGHLTGIDESVLIKRAQAYYDKMKNSYLERDYQHLPREVFFAPAFPME